MATLIKNYRANDNDAYVPEFWAVQAVNILYEEFLFPRLVHRDFEEQITDFGDIVNTRKPAQIKTQRKQNDLDDLEDQDAKSTNIQVELNQRAYASFLLGDREMSLSFQDLIRIYLQEAVSDMGRHIDRVLGAQAYQFLGNSAGLLGGLDTTNAHDYLLDLRKVFNDNNVPETFRNLSLASHSETEMQKEKLFKSAEQIGDNGQALRNAMLGHLAGWDTFRSNNTPSVLNATTKTGSATAATYAAGSTSVNVTATEGSNFAAGDWITIAGDMTPQRVTVVATDTLTLSPGLKRAVASSAAITAYASALVNQGSAIPAGDKTDSVTDGYPAKWQKEIVYDGTGVPQEGQLVSFTTSGGTVQTAKYGIVDIDTTNNTILLDRPLEEAIDDDGLINLGPNGDYNFGFQRNALAFVSRPLIQAASGSGVRTAVFSDNGISVRVSISYDSKKQAHRIVIDLLYGVKPLDTVRGGVLFG